MKKKVVLGVIAALCLIGAPSAAYATGHGNDCYKFDRTPFYSGATSSTKGPVTVTIGEKYQAGKNWTITTSEVLGKITIRSNGGQQDRTGQTLLNGDYGSDIEWAKICVTPKPTPEPETPVTPDPDPEIPVTPEPEVPVTPEPDPETPVELEPETPTPPVNPEPAPELETPVAPEPTVEPKPELGPATSYTAPPNVGIVMPQVEELAETGTDDNWVGWLVAGTISLALGTFLLTHATRKARRDRDEI